MAKTQSEKAQSENTPRRGRQPGQPSNPENAAKRLSEATSRAVWFLSGSPSSAVGILAARAAKQGISRDRVEKAFAHLHGALEIAQTQMEAAYANPTANRESVRRPDITL